MTRLDETLFEQCKWCNGSGNDGTGVCPDCECTGLKGGKYAEKRFDDFVEQMYQDYQEKQKHESNVIK